MDLSLYHLVREPKLKLDKHPLLLLLHGYGSNEEDLFSFANELPPEYYVISVRAPYSLPPYGHAWYSINFAGNERTFTDIDQAKSSRDKIAAFIDELTPHYPINPQEIT